MGDVQIDWQKLIEQALTWFTAWQQAEPVYGYKVLIDDATNLIVGAHLVSPHVDEVINVFALAIRHGLTTNDLKTTMFAYPTSAWDIGLMLSSSSGKYSHQAAVSLTL